MAESLKEVLARIKAQNSQQQAKSKPVAVPVPTPEPTDEEEFAVGVRLKSLYNRFTVARLPVEVRIRDLLSVQLLPQDREEARELGEDQDFVPLFRDLFKLGKEQL